MRCEAKGIQIGCTASDRQPDLHWTDVPGGTTNFAARLIDTSTVPPFVHWTVWGMSSLGKQHQGLNSFGRVGYGAPCPPPGSGLHLYVLTTWALGGPLDVRPGADIHAFDQAVTKAKVLASTRETFRLQQ